MWPASVKMYFPVVIFVTVRIPPGGPALIVWKVLTVPSLRNSTVSPVLRIRHFPTMAALDFFEHEVKGRIAAEISRMIRDLEIQFRREAVSIESILRQIFFSPGLQVRSGPGGRRRRGR